jgi:hypothetical protein
MPRTLRAFMRDSCLGARAGRGDYAWVFDNPDDAIVPKLAGHAMVGFDVTDFLDHEVDENSGHALSLPSGSASPRRPATRVLDG